MPFDLSKVAPEKRAELEKALTEVGSSITELETVHTDLEAQKKEAAEAKTAMEKMEAAWGVANSEYSKVVDSLDATEKEKEVAQGKLDKAEREKIEAQAKLADALKNQPRIDTDKFLTKEEAARLEQGRAGYFGKTLKIMRDHQKLFGEELDPEKFIMEATAAGKMPQEFWEEKYKVGEKRAAIEKDTQDKRDKENENKGYQRAIEESRNPALRTLESSEEPFYTPKVGDRPKQPWDMVDGEVPKDEQDFLKELTTGRVQ